MSLFQRYMGRLALSTATASLSLTSFAAAQNAPAAPDTTPRKPNVIIIMADDLGYSDLSVQGSRDIRTPNIDSLAINGVRFTNGYVTAPQCAPTRAALMTGRYQQRFGFEFNAIQTSNNGGLPLDEITLANHLKKAGYATGLVGKWHLGSLPEQRPQSRGFDEFFGILGGANPYLPPVIAAQLNQNPGAGAAKRAKRAARNARNAANANNADAGNAADAEARAERRAARQAQRQAAGAVGDEAPVRTRRGQSPDIVPNILRGNEPVQEREYLTDALGREASAFIQKHRDKPFYLHLATNAPHGPQQASQKYLDRFPTITDPIRRIYAAQVSALDDAVGRVLQTLRDIKQDENTLIFFVSDNGGPLGDNWNGSDNEPLSGNKGDLREGGIRVPFLVQWKARLPKGRVDARPVIQLDVLPTALAAANAPVPPTQAPDETRAGAIDGVNLLPFLTGTNAGNPHEALFWRFNRGRTPDQFQWAIRQGDLKLLQERESSAPKLLNLNDDLKESRDLSPEQAAQKQALQEKWSRWNAQLQEPAWQIGRRRQAQTDATPNDTPRPRRNGQPRNGQPRDEATLSPERRAKRAARRAARAKARAEAEAKSKAETKAKAEAPQP